MPELRDIVEEACRVVRMEWMDFMASLTESLAWPIAVILLAFIFRRHVAAALGRLTRVEGAGLKASFGSELAEVEEKTARVMTGAEAEVSSLTGLEAERDPSGVVLRGWASLEQEITRAVSSLADTGRSSETLRRSPASLVREAKAVGLLEDEEVVETLGGLRHLRNRVAHGADIPTPGQAATYAQAVADMKSYIRTREEYLHTHGR